MASSQKREFVVGFGPYFPFEPGPGCGDSDWAAEYPVNGAIEEAISMARQLHHRLYQGRYCCWIVDKATNECIQVDPSP